jgi:hypothetical protein
MRKLVLAAAVTLLLTRGSKPVEARCGSDCPPIVDALGWTLVNGMTAIRGDLRWWSPHCCAFG